MGCIKSSVHWHWSYLYFVILVQLGTSVAIVRVLGIRTKWNRDLYRNWKYLLIGKHVCDKYNSDLKKLSYDPLF